MKSGGLIAFCLEILMLFGAMPSFAQSPKRAAEAQAGTDAISRQQAGRAFELAWAEEAEETGLPRQFSQQLPAAERPFLPHPLNFWEDILPVCLVIFALWLTMLILGLTLTSSIAAGIFLILAAWTALFGLAALFGIILALVQLSTQSDRRARRASDPFWRVKRWR